jgi:hypothetical protein
MHLFMLLPLFIFNVYMHAGNTGGGWDPFGTTAGHNAGASRPQVCV